MTMKRTGKIGIACLTAALAFGMILTTSTVNAQENNSESTRNLARKYYEQGKKYYEEKKYTEAEKEFEAAYKAQPHPRVLKSIAECKAALGDIVGAIETLKQALPELADEAEKKGVKDRIEQLKNNLAALDVTTLPPGASIAIDGKDTGKQTPATLKLNQGQHEVMLNLNGYESVSKTTILSAGSVGEVTVDFEKEGVAVKEASSVDEEESNGGNPETIETDNDNSKKLPTGFWISAALTGVGLVSGTVFGVMALSAEKDFDKDRTDQQLADSGKIKALLCDVSFGVAAAAAVVGTIILIANKSDEKHNETGSTIGVVPVAGRDAVGVTAIIEF